MSKIKVGVIRGGMSQEHDVSMKTGAGVLKNLPEQYESIDVVIAENGDWFFDGRISSPERIFRHVDVIFNALHGYFGEDGKVQKIFEQFNIPYTGSGVITSAFGMNKVLARDIFTKAGLNMPRHVVVEQGGDLASAVRKVMEKIGPAWIVKPVSSGSSVGVSVAKNTEQLVEAMEMAFQFDPRIIVEKFIEGREVSCGIAEDFRNEKFYAFPPVEIALQGDSSFYDFHAKISGEAGILCPSGFSLEVKKEIEEMAKKAHEVLGCRHYSCSDFIVDKDGKIYLLEINTLPGLTEQSLLPKATESVGLVYSDLLDHLIKLAMR